MPRWPHASPGMCDFLTSVADFRGWGVRELAGVPRGVRDGAGLTFGTQKRWIFGPELAPTGPQNDSNGLDCVKKWNRDREHDDENEKS